jgi:diguanylate cyclase (GGDEF)-like protein
VNGDKLSELFARVEELERHNAALARAIGLLHEVANLARSSLELEPTVYAVLTGVTAGVGLGLNRAMLFRIRDGEPGLLSGWAAVGPIDRQDADRIWKSIEADAPDLETLYEAGLRLRDSPGPLDTRVRELSIPIESASILADALRQGGVVRGGADDLDGLLHPRTAIAAPVRGRGGAHGVLYADNRFTQRRLDEVQSLVFSLIADHAGRALDSALAFEQVAHQSRTDPLTGLGHRGALKKAVQASVDRAREHGSSLGLAMVDLDGFKQVNDTHGHLAGDALLMEVANRLRAAVRSDETPFRYGGEEFTVLLPGVTLESLVAVGERLRQSVAMEPFALADQTPIRVTCSVGVSVLNGAALDAERLIALADDALLRAKRDGKNRVELAKTD